MSNEGNLKVELDIGKDENGDVKVNGLTKTEILKRLGSGLSCYEILCAPRKIENIDNLTLSTNQIERIIKELLRCNICNEIFQDPVNIKNCLHKFCKKCIEDYNRKVKKECAICRHPVETRRLMKEDLKMKSIINCIIPDIQKFQEEEKKVLNLIMSKCCFKLQNRVKQQLETAKKNEEIEANENKLSHGTQNIHHNHHKETRRTSSNHLTNNPEQAENRAPANTMLGKKVARDVDPLTAFNNENNIVVKLNTDESENNLSKYFTKTRFNVPEHYTLDFISRFICYKQNFKFDQIKKIKFYTINSDKSQKYWDQPTEIKTLMNYQKQHDIYPNTNTVPEEGTPNYISQSEDTLNLYFRISK